MPLQLIPGNETLLGPVVLNFSNFLRRLEVVHVWERISRGKVGG